MNWCKLRNQKVEIKSKVDHKDNQNKMQIKKSKIRYQRLKHLLEIYYKNNKR